MNKFLSFLTAFQFLFFVGFGQLTGIKNIPGAYADLAAAINDLNIAGVGAGGVTLNLLTGNPQTSPAGGYVIGGTSSNASILNGLPANPITIQGNGNLIIAPSPQTSTAKLNLLDAFFKIVGGDYITIEGFVMNENVLNTTTAASSNNMTEFGVALFFQGAPATPNGAKFNTIKNCVIDLDKTYQNTFGIFSSNCQTDTSSTPLPAASIAGNNEGLTIIGNTITDVSQGIAVLGPSGAGLELDGLTIGGSLANANTISDYGATGPSAGYANVTGTNFGILMRFVKNVNVSFNNISTSTTGPAVGTVRGIFMAVPSNPLVGTIVNNINNNTISVKSAVLAGAIQGIFIEGIASNSTTSLNINNNSFNNMGHTIAAATGTITIINNTSTALNTSISNNSFSNIQNQVVSTSTILCISNAPTAAVIDTKLDINGNSFSNIANSSAVNTCIISLISGTSFAAKTTNINSNTFSNLAVNSTANFTFITNNLTMPAGGSQTVSNNAIVGNFEKVGAGGTLILFTTNASSPTGTTSTNLNNNFSNIKVNGAATIAGWINRDGASSISGPIKTISNNTFKNWTGGSSGIIALTENAGAATSVVFNNAINNITATGSAVNGISILQNSNSTFTNNIIDNIVNDGTINGINVSGGINNANKPNIVKNKIVTLEARTAAGIVNGIVVNYSLGTNVTANCEVTIANNIIGDLKAPAATNATLDVIRGISITSIAAISKVNVYYNSIYLNAISSGAEFSTSGLFHKTSTIATTANLNLINNIIINKSTPNGAGKTVAYKRNTTDLVNYAASSNNNLFYAGTPSTTNVIYFDSTNSATLAVFQGLVREAASLTEDVVFKSLVGVDADYLHINIASTTIAKSAAAAIAGFTDDYDGHARAATADIGADEFKTITLALPQIAITGISTTMGNKLTWLSNVSNTNYEVWKSTNGASFIKVADIANTINGQYQFTDNLTSALNNFYKVKQTASNGRIVWSNVVLLKNKINTTLQIESVYPNPTSNQLNVLVGTPNASNLNMLVYSSSGKLMYKKMWSVTTGQNNTQINVSNFSKGVYILKLIANNGTEVAASSFIKQ